MRIWRVAGDTRLQNLDVKAFSILFNGAPYGDRLYSFSARHVQEFAKSFVIILPAALLTT
eukprot:1159805-Pelagomonas_calceolata.AAC.8